MKRLLFIAMVLCLALVGCASAADDVNTTATTTAAPSLIGGDMGAYLINANVEAANVTFDNDFKGAITGGNLKVNVYTTGTPYRIVTVEKTGYATAKLNITQYPAKGETVVMNVTLVKLEQTTAATTTAAAVTSPAVVNANATVPAATVVTTTVATTPQPTPTKAGTLPVVAFAAVGLIGLFAIKARK
ncbi:MAG: hypothetical protein NTZ39_10395 [Methanoregula sp.]|nr:hypothetical protein [Methanoregula sp.]